MEAVSFFSSSLCFLSFVHKPLPQPRPTLALGLVSAMLLPCSAPRCWQPCVLLTLGSPHAPASLLQTPALAAGMRRPPERGYPPERGAHRREAVPTGKGGIHWRGCSLERGAAHKRGGCPLERGAQQRGVPIREGCPPERGAHQRQGYPTGRGCAHWRGVPTKMGVSTIEGCLL